jgi:hypothetical protein
MMPILKEKYFLVSGDPDNKAEGRSDDDIATSEHGKTPAVTDIAVRVADPGVPQTTSAGSNATFAFCIVIPWQEAHRSYTDKYYFHLSTVCTL